MKQRFFFVAMSRFLFGWLPGPRSAESLSCATFIPNIQMVTATFARSVLLNAALSLNFLIL